MASESPPPSFSTVAYSVSCAPASGPVSLTEADVTIRSGFPSDRSVGRSGFGSGIVT